MVVDDEDLARARRLDLLWGRRQALPVSKVNALFVSFADLVVALTSEASSVLLLGYLT